MCPFCRDALAALPDAECGGCSTRHHAVCLEASGCTTLGCPERPARGRGPGACAACRVALAPARTVVCGRCGAAQHQECTVAHGCQSRACIRPWEVAPAAPPVAAPSFARELYDRLGLVLTLRLALLLLWFLAWLAGVVT